MRLSIPYAMETHFTKGKVMSNQERACDVEADTHTPLMATFSGFCFEFVSVMRAGTGLLLETLSLYEKFLLLIHRVKSD